MKKVKMPGDQRRLQIIKVGAEIANKHGLQYVSHNSVGDGIEDLSWRGVKYHFATKKELQEAVGSSGLLTEETLEKGRSLGIIE